MSEKETAGLSLLRVPFQSHQISKLPKPTKQQTEEVRADFKKGIRCDVCDGWHHPKVVHLDYVGHAALTDRLLDADPNWTWEPLAIGGNGLPVLDGDGGLWIRLSVCGVSRLGYGDAQGKTGGDAMKERIGDALRNAAMRFGAALDLWHKGDLRITDSDPAIKPSKGKGAITPSRSCADELTNDERTVVYDSVREAISIYRETGEIERVDRYLRFESGLTQEMLASVPYFLGSAKTDDGKKLSTAWTKYTKANPNKDHHE